MNESVRPLPGCQKISVWLVQFGSHEIINAAELAKNFKTMTGCDSCWPVHSITETREAIVKRGLGGDVEEYRVSGVTALDQRVAWGYEVAAALANRYVNFVPLAVGRGSIFAQSLQALQRGGF